MRLALASGQDEIATEAWARHAFVRGRMSDGDPLRALDGLELIEIIGERARERGAFARALLANNVGSIAAIAGDFERARARFQQASAEAAAVRGPGAVELATTVSNLAMLTADGAERGRLYARALASVTAAVGPDHPNALWKQLQLITDRDDPRAVVTELAALCPRAARLHPALAPLIDLCAFELAWQATALGGGPLVLAAARLGSPGPGRERRLVDVYARLAGGGASRELLGELARKARAEGGAPERLGWYQHMLAADAELVLAAAARAARDPALAGQAATRATAHLERMSATTGVSGGLVQRRLAWARELGVAGD